MIDMSRYITTVFAVNAAAAAVKTENIKTMLRKPGGSLGKPAGVAFDAVQVNQRSCRTRLRMGNVAEGIAVTAPVFQFIAGKGCLEDILITKLRTCCEDKARK